MVSVRFEQCPIGSYSAGLASTASFFTQHIWDAFVHVRQSVLTEVRLNVCCIRSACRMPENLSVCISAPCDVECDKLAKLASKVQVGDPAARDTHSLKGNLRGAEIATLLNHCSLGQNMIYVHERPRASPNTSSAHRRKEL